MGASVGQLHPTISSEFHSVVWRDALLVALPIVTSTFRTRARALPEHHERLEVVRVGTRKLSVPVEVQEAYWRSVDHWAMHVLERAEVLLMGRKPNVGRSGNSDAEGEHCHRPVT